MQKYKEQRRSISNLGGEENKEKKNPLAIKCLIAIDTCRNTRKRT